MTDPFSSTEVVVQLIQNLTTSNYAGLSAAIMFIWDYGGLTSHVVDRMTPLVFGSLSVSDHV
jgi:hypothetical protein